MNLEDRRGIESGGEVRAQRSVRKVLDVDWDLLRSTPAEDRSEQEDEDNRERDREERADAGTHELNAERLDVRKDPLHVASSPSAIRAPTTLRKTSSRLERFV